MKKNDELFWIMSKGLNFNSSNFFIVMPTCIIIIKSIICCINSFQKVPFFAHPQFLWSLLTSPILHIYVEAWVSVLVDIQSLPLLVVSSPFYDPCILVFMDDEDEVSIFW